MRRILVFYSFSIHTFRNVSLSFIESWANPISVVIVVVVQVLVLAIHIPHVVVVISRPKPTRLENTHRTYLVFPYIYAFKVVCLTALNILNFGAAKPKFNGRCHFFQKFAPSLSSYRSLVDCRF